MPNMEWFSQACVLIEVPRRVKRGQTTNINSGQQYVWLIQNVILRKCTLKVGVVVTSTDSNTTFRKSLLMSIGFEHGH